jgi:hypothetical protein
LIEHVELLASTRVWGQQHDLWEVRASNGRWWVTYPTMVFLDQRRFPSAEVALTYHIGFLVRDAHRGHPEGSDEEQRRLSESWRRWRQAVDALNQGDEAEDIQAVGMKCRECLLAFVRETASDTFVPIGTSAPQRGNVSAWSALIAAGVAPGRSSARLRSYLVSATRET